jgi:uncharacterized protein YjbI with pentapeptide repeats
VRDGLSYTGETFRAFRTEGGQLDRSEFDQCVFDRCVFSRSVLAHCRFTSCRFVGCDLSNIAVPSSRFRDVRFEATKLLGVDWTKGDAMAEAHAPTSLSFVDCVVDLSSFFGLNLRTAVMQRCSAKEVDLSEADLRDAVCRGTDFAGAKFQGTNLERADLREAMNYAIDPRANRVKGARFSLPEAVALLRGFAVVVE